MLYHKSCPERLGRPKLMCKHISKLMCIFNKKLRLPTLCGPQNRQALTLFMYFPKHSMLYGVLADQRAIESPRSPRGINVDEKMIVAVVFIDTFDPPHYCSGKVPQTRALQPQQHFRARCLQNHCENHFFPKSHFFI